MIVLGALRNESMTSQGPWVVHVRVDRQILSLTSISRSGCWQPSDLVAVGERGGQTSQSALGPSVARAHEVDDATEDDRCRRASVAAATSAPPLNARPSSAALRDGDGAAAGLPGDLVSGLALDVQAADRLAVGVGDRVGHGVTSRARERPATGGWWRGEDQRIVSGHAGGSTHIGSRNNNDASDLWRAVQDAPPAADHGAITLLPHACDAALPARRGRT